MKCSFGVPLLKHDKKFCRDNMSTMWQRDCHGLTQQGAKHHGAVHSVPAPSGMAERIGEKKVKFVG